jgi:hypothetical protein
MPDATPQRARRERPTHVSKFGPTASGGLDRRSLVCLDRLRSRLGPTSEVSLDRRA